MKAIVSVVGKDQVGIIAKICSLLANENVNVLDIDQSIMEGYFNMFMIVRLLNGENDFNKVQDNLLALGERMNIEIMIQRTEIFETMTQIGGSHD